MLKIWLPKRLAEEAMQKSNHQDAKLHLSECKVTPIMVQSYKHQDAIPNFSDFNLKYLLSINVIFSDSIAIFAMSVTLFIVFGFATLR